MDVILDIIARIFGFFSDLLVSPILADGMYRRGFLSGIFVTVLLGFFGGKIIRCIRKAQAMIAAFFQPSPLPALRDGPSGYTRARGCGQGTLMLVGMFICFILFAALAIAALLRLIPSP